MGGISSFLSTLAARELWGSFFFFKFLCFLSLADYRVRILESPQGGSWGDLTARRAVCVWSPPCTWDQRPLGTPGSSSGDENLLASSFVLLISEYQHLTNLKVF